MRAAPARRIEDILEMRGAPILNPVTGAEHRARIELPHGFEFTSPRWAAAGSSTPGPCRFKLADSYAQLARIHLNQSGIVR